MSHKHFFGTMRNTAPVAVALGLRAAGKRDDIKLEEGVPMPSGLKVKRSVDEWDDFWKRARKGQSFVVTESFSHTVKASAAKRGIILVPSNVGVYKIRLWIVSK